ncbi:hypothetical protein SBOR_5902 [Sclerotinia borealis F-4128]|uniref:Uncharacterized protein n=1 Tax=Sclerotinia borealis (strain F-4128) TaxID=1432307 RepID=W9CAC0_SCLBF|nr:hypothetical protein SBOR_5902 [Sclerotinia borealis F-4128]
MDSSDSENENVNDEKSVVSSLKSAVSSPSSPHSPTYLTGHIPTKWYHLHLRTVTLITLPILFLVGIFGTLIIGGRNGTFELIVSLVEQETPSAVFPGAKYLLLKDYTGVRVFDRQLTVLVAFFAPVCDSRNVALWLNSIFGLGQFGAAWTLLVMESLRSGNKGRAVSFIGTVGVIFQNISYAITVPLYLFIHLLTSPVAKLFPGTYANSVLLISSLDLKILPLSITLAYIVPSILMGLDAPSIVSGPTHQKLIALWQPFPVWTILIQWTLRSFFQFVGAKLTSKDSKQAPAPLGASYLSNAKHVYRFLLALCVLTHLPILLIALIPASAISDILPKLAPYANLNFFDIYVPYFPFPLTQRVSDLASGSHTFLQWDLATGSTALLLWAILLYRNATTERAIVDPNTSLPSYQIREMLAGERSKAGALRRKLLVKISVWTVLSGPIGAATALLWERDEIVRQKIKQGI